MSLGRAATFVALLAWPASAGAREPLKLEYYDAAGCETASGFTEAVHALTRLVRLAAPGELARTFRVALRRDGSGLVEGQVTGVAPGGATLRLGARGTCEEVLGMLSFGIAFTLDPTAEPTQPETLPENPYWSWLASLPPEPPLPENPYRAQHPSTPLFTSDPSFPENPYRSGGAMHVAVEPVSTAGDALPSNPYR